MKRVRQESGVDLARQERLWAGMLSDAEDFAGSLGDIGSLFAYRKEGGKDEEAREEVQAEQQQEPVAESTWVVFQETHNAAFSACLPQFDVRARLGEIKARTLVVVGRHDWLTPVEGAEEIVEGIKGGGGEAELVVFEESGHNPTSEEVEKWRAVAWRWLGEDRHVVVRE